jgi:hypothetical protein
MVGNRIGNPNSALGDTLAQCTLIVAVAARGSRSKPKLCAHHSRTTPRIYAHI